MTSSWATNYLGVVIGYDDDDIAVYDDDVAGYDDDSETV